MQQVVIGIWRADEDRCDIMAQRGLMEGRGLFNWHIGNQSVQPTPTFSHWA